MRGEVELTMTVPNANGLPPPGTRRLSSRSSPTSSESPPSAPTGSSVEVDGSAPRSEASRRSELHHATLALNPGGFVVRWAEKSE